MHFFKQFQFSEYPPHSTTKLLDIHQVIEKNIFLFFPQHFLQKPQDFQSFDRSKVMLYKFLIVLVSISIK